MKLHSHYEYVGIRSDRGFKVCREATVSKFLNAFDAIPVHIICPALRDAVVSERAVITRLNLQNEMRGSLRLFE